MQPHLLPLDLAAAGRVHGVPERGTGAKLVAVSGVGRAPLPDVTARPLQGAPRSGARGCAGPAGEWCSVGGGV